MICRRISNILIKKTLNKVKKSNEAKKLISNFLSLTLLQIAGYVFPLLTVPYLAHTIGVDKYGEIAFAAAIMIYFQTLVDYGFVFSAVRDIARCGNDKRKISEIYSRVMYSRLFLLLISAILVTLCTLIIPKFYAMRWIILCSFFMVVGHTLFPDWMFQALERMKYITIFNVLVKFLFTIAVFLFIHHPEDYLLQPIFTSVGFLICGVGSMWLIHKWGIKLMRCRFADIVSSLKLNFDLFLNQLVPNLYNSASVLMLGFFYGDTANGVFDAGNKFNSVGSSLFSIISRTFYPFLSRRIDKHTFFRNLNFSVSSIIALFLFLAAPFIIHTFFPPDFDGAIVVLRIISVSLVFLAMNNIYGTNYLILKGYEKDMRQITLYSSLIGLVLAIPLVYFGSYIGVAVTICVSRGLLGVWSMIKAKQIKVGLTQNAR